MFTLNPDSSTPLVSQIVDGFRRMVGEQALKPGAKVPSIRAFAASHGVSVFTVVEAYDRLAAESTVEARRGSERVVRWIGLLLIVQLRPQETCCRTVFSRWERERQEIA